MRQTGRAARCAGRGTSAREAQRFVRPPPLPPGTKRRTHLLLYLLTTHSSALAHLSDRFGGRSAALFQLNNAVPPPSALPSGALRALSVPSITCVKDAHKPGSEGKGEFGKWVGFLAAECAEVKFKGLGDQYACHIKLAGAPGAAAFKASQHGRSEEA